jgi:predicted dehydrogenase
MSKKVRYGLIGTGMMGAEHIVNLKLMPEAEIVAISDPTPSSLDWATAVLGEDLAGKVEAYADHRDLLKNPKIDAVLIASPNYTHAGILQDMWGSSRHILCEKPLTTTLEDGQRVLDKAMAHKGVFWVAMEYRYMPPAAEFIARVHQGETGDLRMLAIREHRFPFLKKVGDWNRFAKNTGGTMVEKCCHFFDLMRLIVKSEAVRVYCSGAMDVNHRDERYDGKTPDIIDNSYTVVDFANGVRAMLDLCMFAEGAKNQEEIVAVGDKAKLEVFIPDGDIVFSPRVPLGHPKKVVTANVAVDETALKAGSHHGATYYQHRKFLDAILSGGKAEVTAEDGFRAIAIGHAAELSAREGRAVTMKSLGL